MDEQPLTYEELPPLALPTLPTAHIWATSTDLAGTDKERKQYFIHVQDGERTIRFSLHVHADGMIQAEPYVVHEIDYWDYDGWDDPDDEDDDDEDYWFIDGDDEDYYPDEDGEEEDTEA